MSPSKSELWTRVYRIGVLVFMVEVGIAIASITITHAGFVARDLFAATWLTMAVTMYARYRIRAK